MGTSAGRGLFIHLIPITLGIITGAPRAIVGFIQAGRQAHAIRVDLPLDVESRVVLGTVDDGSAAPDAEDDDEEGGVQSSSTTPDPSSTTTASAAGAFATTKAPELPTRVGLIGNYFRWRFDPFTRPFTENEFARFAEPQRTEKGIPSTFSPVNYYVDPVYETRRAGWTLSDLRRPEPTIIFGEYGTGKSMLRLALEVTVRGRYDGSLTVTYKPTERHEIGPGTADVSPDSHLRAITRELALDLFIQIVERFNVAAPPPTPEQNRKLCDLLGRLDYRTRSQINDLIVKITDPNQTAPDSLWGYAESWPQRFGRIRVNAVHRSLELEVWMKQLIALRDEPGQFHLPGRETGREQLDEALAVARLWGFERALVLVDNVDDHQMEPAAVWSLARALVADATGLAEQGLFLKLFLPASLEARVAEEPSAGAIHTLRLQWNERRLRKLLHERFRAAGTYRRDFGDLAEPGLDDLDEQLLAAADGSPRRLIRLVDEMFHAYVGRLAEAGLAYGAPIREADMRAAMNKVRDDAERR